MTDKAERDNARLRFHVPKATHRGLKAIAAYNGESLAQTIRRAVEQYVREHKQKAADA